MLAIAMCLEPMGAPETIEDRQPAATPGREEPVCAGSQKMSDTEAELSATGCPEVEQHFERRVRRHCLRSLEELCRDFKWRRGKHFRPLKELTLDFQRRQAIRLRVLDELAQDSKQRHGESHGTMTQALPELPMYERTQLLAVLKSMGKARAERKLGALGISTLRLPSLAAGAAQPARSCPYIEDPRLDDESIVADIEARLSRESGADAKNAETFGGECGPGWTFEEAVQANRAFKELEGCVSTVASGSEPSERASESGTGDLEDSWEGRGDAGCSGSGCASFSRREPTSQDVELVAAGSLDLWHLDRQWGPGFVHTRRARSDSRCLDFEH